MISDDDAFANLQISSNEISCNVYVGYHVSINNIFNCVNTCHNNWQVLICKTGFFSYSAFAPIALIKSAHTDTVHAFTGFHTFALRSP